jgi:glycosyltransferase involved in cell wall biosynthesis
MNLTVPWSVRRSTGLIAVSEFTRDEIVAVYGTPREKITVAHNGVDPVFLDGTRRPSLVEPPFFLAAGNLEPRKNLVTLIRAYRALLARRPDLPERLVLVGKEWFGSDLVMSEAGSLIEAGRVLFTGYVGDDRMVGLLQGATALVYPSLYEGFGLPPVEAMAVGTPAVVSDIPVTREVAGDAALLVPPLDQEAWTVALDRVSTDPNLRRDLAARGREQAGRFTWEASARSVVAALERAARPPA